MANNDRLGEQFPSLELVLEQLQRQLDAQSDHWDQIDRRSEILLGFVGVIFAAILAFGRLEDLTALTEGFLLVGILLLMTSALLTASAWSPRDFGYPPKPDYLFENYPAMAPVTTMTDIASSIVTAYNVNQEHMDEKLRLFKFAIVTTSGGVLAVAGTLVSFVLD